MAQCQRISIKKREPCIGDLRNRIILYDRDLGANNTNDPDYDLTFTNAISVWAGVVTLADGQDVFSGVNIVAIAKHKFIIRYRSGITSEKWIQFNSKNYDILSIEDPEERHEFLILYCNERGDSSKATNRKGI